MTTLPQTRPATPRPTFYPKTVVSRTTQLGVAHDLARRCGYNPRPGSRGRAEYEAMLTRTVGVTSLKRASREQRNAVIRALEDELARRAEAVVRAPALDPSEYDDAAFMAILGL